MEFDWHNPPVSMEGSLTPQVVEESFEDPFMVRILPDTPRFSVQARFFNLGKSSSGMGIFSVFRTNGKVIRVICARPFVPEEEYFYQRRMNKSLLV